MKVKEHEFLSRKACCFSQKLIVDLLLIKGECNQYLILYFIVYSMLIKLFLIKEIFFAFYLFIYFDKENFKNIFSFIRYF